LKWVGGLGLGGVVGGWVVTTVLDEGLKSAKTAVEDPINAADWPGQIQAEGPHSLSQPQFVLPLTRAQVGERALPAGEDYTSWAESVGGVRCDELVIPISVTANIPTVAFTGMNVEVRSRRPAMEGIWLRPFGAGDYYERVWSVNLDTDPPASRLVDVVGGDQDFPISLGEGDTLIVVVIAEALRFDVEFVVNLSYIDSSSGEAGSLTFDDDGKPYRLTGVATTRECFTWNAIGEMVWGRTVDFDTRLANGN
jgi:hypothetical protein